MKTQTEQPSIKFHSYPEQYIKIIAWYRINEREVNGTIKKVYYSGSVTVENGKMKISISNRNFYSYSEKVFIENTVREQFFNYRTSPIFYSFTEVKNDLIAELRTNTQGLKDNYFAKRHNSAIRIYKYNVGLLDARKKEMDELILAIRADKRGIGSEYWELRRKYKEVSDLYEYSKQLSERGFESFLKAEMDDAEAHYESSLIKLAARLTAKGVEGDMEITSGWVGQNFEVNIKHSKGVTRAWTIIAEGPIVRAHYRYLVK